MDPKNKAQERNRKKETQDAGLFLRMLLLLKSMLNYMKAVATGKMFHIEIQNASGRRGGIGDKGEHTIIRFNAFAPVVSAPFDCHGAPSRLEL